MRKTACIVLACGVVLAVTAGLLTGRDGRARETEPAAVEKAGVSQHKADEQAIRKVSAELTRALEKGDPRALAGLWTEEGEYVADDGTTIRGRPALEAAYRNSSPRPPTSRSRPPSIPSASFRDSAIEEGVAKVAARARWRSRSPARYSILYVREDGHWHIATAPRVARRRAQRRATSTG